MQILESSISSVTVFSDRAEVTRTSALELTAGEHTVVFDMLPDKIEQKSVQVGGVGDAILSSVKFKVEHFEEVPDADKKVLLDDKQALEDELQWLNYQKKRLDNEKKFVENITVKLTTPVEDDAPMLDPAQWDEMFTFYQDKSTTLDEAIFSTEKEQQTLQQKTDKLDKQLRDLQYNNTRIKKQVEVIVQMKSPGHLQLNLSYIVRDAQWRPFYDLRVSTESQKMNLTYNALIKQNTNEDWNDVAIKLSTAEPQISGRQPELIPWRIDVGGRIAKENLRNLNFNASYAPAPTKVKGKLDAAEQAAKDFGGEGEREDLKKATSEVETSITSVFFNIAGVHTIKSDNIDQQVTVMLEDFDASFEYSAVPKLSPYAYLRAKVTNNTQYPLLAGSTNVFLNNNFVANASIDTIAPTEVFWTFLGIDEGLKIERKFLKKYEKKEGKLFAKKAKNIVYEYEIIVQNYKKSTEKITVKDQIPISQHDEIKVHLLLPDYKEDTDQLKKGEYNYLEWTYEMPPGSEQKIPFHFALEYPHDIKLTGIEDV